MSIRTGAAARCNGPGGGHESTGRTPLELRGVGRRLDQNLSRLPPHAQAGVCAALRVIRAKMVEYLRSDVPAGGWYSMSHAERLSACMAAYRKAVREVYDMTPEQIRRVLARPEPQARRVEGAGKRAELVASTAYGKVVRVSDAESGRAVTGLVPHGSTPEARLRARAGRS